MSNKFEKFLSKFELNEPATTEAIKNLEKEVNIHLPNEYRDFLLVSNGGEGTLGESYLALWKVEDIAELNKDYGVEEFAPGLIIIGSDGGDTAYCINNNSESLPFVQIPFISMNLDEVQLCGNTFSEFLEYLILKV